PLPVATVVVVTPVPATVVGGAGGASVGLPPHPEIPSRRQTVSVLEQARTRVMQGPPWWKFAQRRRILTDDPRAVNCSRRAALAALALAVMVGTGARPARAADRELHLLVVLAGFPDRPLAKQREHF